MPGHKADTVVAHMPMVPASTYRPAPDGVDPSRLVWAETVAPGGYAHRVLASGYHGSAAPMSRGMRARTSSCTEPDEPWERLCVADTVKVQWQAYSSSGQLLLSDQGRVLASVTADSSGCHDSICGTTTRTANEARYGSGSPEGPSPAGRELFVLAAAKHGLTPRDLPPSMSFFKGVRVEPSDGRLTWVGGCGHPSALELRAELPLLLLVANTAHPLDPRPVWSATALEILAWSGAADRPR